MLTKFVEDSIGNSVLTAFYMIMLSAFLATVVGAMLIPTFQRVFSRSVELFSIERSVPKLLLHGFSKNGVLQFESFITVPSKASVASIDVKKLPVRILLFNTIAVSILVVGALAPIYAGILTPELRATCLSLSGIINGIATILLFVFIDPHLSMMTDDVVAGSCSEAEFRRCVVSMVGTKVVGTAIAIPMLIPAARVISIVARII